MRQQLSEQLAVSRNLTKKIQDNNSSDDEIENNHDVVKGDIAVDPSNPWLNKGPTASKEVTDFLTGYRKYWQDRNLDNEVIKSQGADDFEDKSIESKKENNLEEISKFKNSSNIEKENNNTENNLFRNNDTNKKIIKEVKSTSEWQVDIINEVIRPGYCNKNSIKDVTELFSSLENDLQTEVSHRISKLQEQYDELNKPWKGKKGGIKKIESDEEDELSKLEFKRSKKSQIDKPLMETSHKNDLKDQSSLDLPIDIKVSDIPNGVDHNTEKIGRAHV